MFEDYDSDWDGYQAEAKSVWRRAKRNAARASQLVTALLEHRSRYQVLVLTLTYRDDLRPLTDFEQMQRDRDAFFYYAYSDEYMRRVMGYVWKIEFGMDHGGLHLHVVLFYDGTAYQDITYAELIGEYWTRITEGRGVFFNSNKYKKRNAQGQYGDITGRLDRGDSDKIENVNDYLAGYTAKISQQVPMRTNPKAKLFGTSQFPR